MRWLFLCACIATLAAATTVKRSHEPEPATTGQFTMVHPAIKELEACKVSHNETLKLAQCFEVATRKMPTNHSWWASLSLLYLRAELTQHALEAANTSANVWVKGLLPQLQKADKDQNKLRWVDLLRFVYDDDSEGEGARRQEAVEMGLLLAKKFELEHKVADAHSIYYEFLLQIPGQGESQVVDFHRRTGNIIAMILSGGQNETSVLFRVAEAILPIVEGFSEHLMTYPQHPMTDTVRRMCGLEWSSNEVIKVRDIVNGLVECVAERWGNLTTVMEKEPEEQALAYASSMKESPIHRLASVGATGILKQVASFFEGKFIPADRFGRTALHLASANGHESTIELLLKQGGDIDQKDKGKITARHLGCSSPKFRKNYETLIKRALPDEYGAVAGSKICDEAARRRMEDEDAEVTDDSGNDGEWNPKQKIPSYLHCDFDVRDMSKLTQTDMMVAYTHSNHPVLLRNAFYDTDGPDKVWKKSRFNKTYGKVAIRQERFPLAERFGLGKANITTVSDFLSTLKIEDGTVGNVFVDHVNHPLTDLASDWTPPAFVNKKRVDEIELYDSASATPMVLLMKKGSKSNHFVRSHITYHSVVYGHQEWTVLPPNKARSMREPLTESPHAWRCEVYTGDVLVLPDMWSASWVAKSNGVSMERKVFKKTAA